MPPFGKSFELGFAAPALLFLLSTEAELLDDGEEDEDAEAGKETFITLLGLDGAKARARELVDAAVARLDLFGERAFLLRDVAHYVIERRS